MRLPLLREELQLHAGAAAADGSPTWNLHDPVRNQFFRVDWPTFEILARWALPSREAIAESIAAETPLDVAPDDVDAVRDFLAENELIRLGDPASSRRLAQRAQAHQGLWQWLLHHYLFFRIPLVRPDAWLARTLPLVAPLFSRAFLVATLIALLSGTLLCLRQWPQFSATLLDTFSPSGLLGYGLALTVVKTLHELGHAFTARRKGCRVPTMGVAFLVMWPVAYTDVNEVWKLPRRRDRLAVGAAGIATELAIAAWASLAWALLPDGALRNVAFLLATTTWISTLAVNASPFMRFDGYFILSDLLDMPNLHARSFALARWQLREWLFGLGEDPPEAMPRRRRHALVAFAWGVWIYRLGLYLGIALLVYHFFIKAVGVLLFAVEIWVFLVQPVWREVSAWRSRGLAIRRSVRSRWSLAALGALLVVACVPWQGEVAGQGLLRPSQRFGVYSPSPAQIESLHVVEGATVAAGDVLMVLRSPELDRREAHAVARVRELTWQASVAGLDDGLRGTLLSTQEELSAARASLEGLAAERARLTLRAPFDGIVRDLSVEARAGLWVGSHERLATVVAPGAWMVETFLTDSEVQRIAAGEAGRFWPESSGLRPLPLEVVRIDVDASRALAEPLLSSAHGGQIVTRERNGQVVPERAVYRVVLEARAGLDANAGSIERGRVVIEGERRSLAGRFLKSAINVVVREAGW